MTLELVLSAVGCALLCYTLGRYNRAATLQRWQFVLNAPERRVVDSLRQRMALDSALARQALEAAGRSREASRAPDALTVLRVALSILEEAGADRLTRLRAMGVYARMGPGHRASARAGRRAVPGPGAAGGRLGRGPRPRPARGHPGALQAVAPLSRTRRPGRPAGQPPFGRGCGPGAAREAAPRRLLARCRDFEVLDACHLTAFEALVASLSAVDRGGRLRLWERIVGDAG